MKKKMTKSEAGLLGAKQTHKNRYNLLTELSKYVDKAYQNYLFTWKTSHLERLLNAYKNEKSKKS